MRISDWSSDVCSSDLSGRASLVAGATLADTPSMSNEDYLKHQFLVAMPRLDDENFTHTVSLLCEHSDDGAIGLVINRPTDLKLSEMMEQMELEHQGLADEAIVFWGGRSEEHTSELQSLMRT